MSKSKRTEGDMLALLRRRYGAEPGNGPAYAFVPHVRNDAGFNASRTIDAIVMSLWPSRGLSLYAFEVKCSRPDWLAEMREPAKAEAFQRYVDYFYLVAATDEIVQPGELPETWGLMVPGGKGLRVVSEAPKQESESMTRGMLAALLRQAGVEAVRSPEEINEALQKGLKEGFDQGLQSQSNEVARLKQRIDDFHRVELDVVRKTGVSLHHLSGRDEAFYSAVKVVLDGERDVEHLRSRIRRIGEDAKVLTEQAERIMEKHS